MKNLKQNEPIKLIRLLVLILVFGTLTTSIIINTDSSTNLAQPTGTISGRVCVDECPYIEPTPTPEPTLTPVSTNTVTPMPTESPTPTPNVTIIVTPTVTQTPIPIEGATIAYLGDSRPSQFGNVGITELTKDLNQVIPQSPTNSIDAIFMIGDMDHVSQTVQAYQASNVSTIPMYFVVGNHEIDQGDMNYLRSMIKSTNFTIYVGPIGTEKTTYSVNIKNIHVTNLNIYWDESNNDAWFKYGSGDGGYVGTKLMTWLTNDLSNTTNWKIVLVHEPLYPLKRHVGDSLDKNPTNRNNLQNLLINQNVKVLVAAHTHYADVNLHNSVYHVDAGISGQKTVDGEDPYASITYTNSTDTTLTLTWKHENPTWTTSKIETYTINR